MKFRKTEAKVKQASFNFQWDQIVEDAICLGCFIMSCNIVACIVFVFWVCLFVCVTIAKCDPGDTYCSRNNKAIFEDEYGPIYVY